MTLQDAEKLIRKPRRWSKLTDAELEALVIAASWLSAVNDDEALDAAAGRLYEHVVDTLPAHERRRIAAGLGEMLEAFGRDHGTCPAAVLQHWLLTDPDFGVVSTAALIAAQVTETSDEDPLAGPRSILELAVATIDQDRQAAMVTGLAAMGDSRVLALVDRDWDLLGGDAQSDILQHMGSHAPTVAAVEFLVSRLERAAGEGQEGPIGHVVASLVRISNAAGKTAGDSPFGGLGVRAVERAFPSWRAAPGANVVTVRGVDTVAEIGKQIGPRLLRAASRETYPRLLPLALRAWGVDDAPFVDAVRQAVAESGAQPGASAVLDEPLPIEPSADWERDDAVLEWGILNPFGPTRVLLSLVPVDENTRALVYSLHNPFGPVCLLLGVTRAGASVGEMLLELADRFQIGDHVLLKGLPHWVRMSDERDRLRPDDAVAFFRKLHQTALANDLAVDGDIDLLIGELDQLRRNPHGEVRRQFAQAAALTSAALADADAHGADAALSNARKAWPRHAPATIEAYERWFRAASTPGHVSDVSTHFMGCWNAALRFQRGSGGESE